MKLRCVLCVALGLAMALMIACAAASSVCAADDASDYKTVYVQWRNVLSRLQMLSNQMSVADEVQRDRLRQEGTVLIDQGKTLSIQLKAAAEKALAVKSNDTPEVVELLRNMAGAALRDDDFEEADRLARLLVDNDQASGDTYKLAGKAAYCANDFPRATAMFAKAEAVMDEATSVNFVAPLAAGEQGKWLREVEIRRQDAAAVKGQENPRVNFKTSKGQITVELFENQAPNTVANFISLVEVKKYDGTKFHRVIAGAVAECGDPLGNGTGGPGYAIADESELRDHRDHFRGSLSMKHGATKDSGGSVFRITFRPAPNIDGQYTVFGRVIDGIDVLARLNRVDPAKQTLPPDQIETATVIRKREHVYLPQKLGAQ